MHKHRKYWNKRQFLSLPQSKIGSEEPIFASPLVRGGFPCAAFAALSARRADHCQQNDKFQFASRLQITPAVLGNRRGGLILSGM